MRLKGRHIVVVVVLLVLLAVALVTFTREEDVESVGLEKPGLGAKAKDVALMSKEELRDYVQRLEVALKWQAQYRAEEAELAQSSNSMLKEELQSWKAELGTCKRDKAKAQAREMEEAHADASWATAATRDQLLEKLLIEEDWELEKLETRKVMLESSLRLGMPLAKPYFFVHLAKTGGTSLINSIRQAVSRLSYLHFWRTPDEDTAAGALNPFVRGTYEGIERTLEVIMGHVSYGVHQWWPEEAPLDKYTYFTVLRDPVSRVVSHYKYHLTNAADPHHKHAVGRTLSQWVKDVKFGQNAMTAFLSGYQHSDWWNADNPDIPLLAKVVVLPEDEYRHDDGLEWPGDDEVRSSNCTELRDSNYRVTYAHYKEARRNLLTMLVGLQEHYEESISHFNTWLSLGNGLATQHQNAGKSMEQLTLTQEDLDTIYLHNEWDMRLYSLARALFEQQRDVIREQSKEDA